MSKIATLIIYAYSSFVSSHGVGPALVKKFEARCRCQVKLVSAGDGGGMINRLKMEGEDLKADVVIGIDETWLSKLKELGWKEEFHAFDYAPFSFVYNSKVVKNPPENLDDLLKPEWKGQIILQDPRLSTVGLGFLLWVVKEKKDKAWEYLEKLKSQVKIISPNWDLAYGLFKKGKAKLVFSYWTSPAYHIQEEKRSDFEAALFNDGHYVQREYLTLSPYTKNKELALKFVKFIKSKEVQEEFPKRNYMYPVSDEAVLTAAFKKLGKPKLLQPLTDWQLKNLDDWLKRWREIFGK